MQSMNRAFEGYLKENQSAISRGDFGMISQLKTLLRSWMNPLDLNISRLQQNFTTHSLQQLQRLSVSKSEELKLQKYLTLVDTQILVVLVLQCVLRSLYSHNNYQPPLLHVTEMLGSAVHSEVRRALLLKHESSLKDGWVEMDLKKKISSALMPKNAQKSTGMVNYRPAPNNRLLTAKIAQLSMLAKLECEELTVAQKLKLGAPLMKIFMECTKVKTKGLNGEDEYVGAFHSVRGFKDDALPRKSISGKLHQGMYLVPHPEIVNCLKPERELILKSLVPRYLPMTVAPKPWLGLQDGGYLNIKQQLMRTRHVSQKLALKQADLSQVFRALDALGSQAWKVNQRTLDVAIKMWNDGGAVAQLVARADVQIPDGKGKYELQNRLRSEYEEFVELQAQHEHDVLEQKAKDVRALRYALLRQKNEIFAAEKTNRERHSLRCDTTYKLDGCQMMSKFERIYLPHNLDFRGRAYPLPVDVQHMGSDLTRAMLVFADAKPVTYRGLFWMKIQLANLLGKDKLSFEDRVDYAESVMPQVEMVAKDPFHDKSLEFWAQSEDPFQLLGCCQAFGDAISMGVSRMHEYESHLPIHQDGSCNGLQHYAALGRDLIGGTQVNLTPSEKPMDVYSAIAEKVAKIVHLDAGGEDQKIEYKSRKEMEERAKHVEIAKKLDGKITRKLVKQTVMTSVYGVTQLGARDQIARQIKEMQLLHAEDRKAAASYIAKITLESIGDLFSEADSIKVWFQDVAKNVAEAGHLMEWVTPMGLPVVQPYCKQENTEVRTVLQKFSVKRQQDMNGKLKASMRKQKSAFPPNFVHSLDSCHMMMTATECKKQGLDFAAVHDSFWTSPAHVDQMNVILRENFIALHRRPLLNELVQYIHMKHPGIEIPQIPQLGDLNLDSIRDSNYFFD